MTAAPSNIRAGAAEPGPGTRIDGFTPVKVYPEHLEPGAALLPTVA